LIRRASKVVTRAFGITGNRFYLEPAANAAIPRIIVHAQVSMQLIFEYVTTFLRCFFWPETEARKMVVLQLED
jgi:hypothetical protein